MRDRGSRWPVVASQDLGTFSMAGTALFLALVAVLHFLSPGFNPIQRPTSEYAVGPFGYLMAAAFLSLSLGTWALVIGLRRDLSKPARSTPGLVFLGLFGIGLLVAATFPIDLDGAPSTLAGTIHAINGSLAFLALVVGTILVSRRLKKDDEWRPIYRVALVLALILLAAFVAGGIAAATETWAGIAQRSLLVTFASWFLLVGYWLRSRAGSPSVANSNADAHQP